MKKYNIVDLTEMYRDSLKSCAVKDCTSVKEFLEKYHIDDHKECTSSGSGCSKEEYFKVLEHVLQEEFDNLGFTIIYASSSKTGKQVSLF